MKRILAVLLALILIVSVLCSCSGADPNADATSDSASVEAKSGKIKKNTEAEDEDKNDPAPASKTNNSKLADSFDSAGDVSYVMIYNPDIYDENSSSNKKLSTGKLSKWIDTSVSRADGLDTEPEITRISQSALSKGVKDVDADTEGDRASSLQPTYKENDKQDFYYLSNISSDKKEKDTYTCSYVGKYCYVWTLPSEKIKNKRRVRLERRDERRRALFAGGRGQHLRLHPGDLRLDARAVRARKRGPRGRSDHPSDARNRS